MALTDVDQLWIADINRLVADSLEADWNDK
jgi:hypothetical protein